MSVLVVRANLGGIDKPIEDQPQSMPCDFITYTDENFPPRDRAMTPRLQAKIPKFFAWQLKPGYDYYLWLDGNLRLKDHTALEYLLNQIKEHDIVVLRHPDRNTIHWEYRYNYRGLNSNAPSNYLTKRYAGEWLDEQYQLIKGNTSYEDDLLVNGGVFLYRNFPRVQKMLKEWWYHTTRYLIMDQLAFPYLLKTSGVRYKVLPDVFRDCWWLENGRHAK